MESLTINERINLKSHQSLRALHSDGLRSLYVRGEYNKNSDIYANDTDCGQWHAPLQLSDIQSSECFERRYIND